MSFTLCSSGAIVRKAGKNADSTAVASGSLLAQYSEDAEGLICAVARYDYVTNYAKVSATGKLFLAQVASDLGGVYLIQYQMANYTGRGEAEDMITVLRDRANEALKILQDKKTEDFLI